MAEDQAVEDGNESIKELRRAADEGRRAAAEAAAAKRELAFLRAGVDVDSPIGKLLIKSYEGELDVEAIKAEAVAVGAVKAPETPAASDPGLSAEEMEQTRLRNDLASNSGTPSNHEANPYDQALEAYRRAQQEGVPMEQRAAAALAPVFEAAARGDRRVLG